MRTTKLHTALPIGRVARIAYEIEAMRGACSRAANVLMSKDPLDEAELEECARLDEALAKAFRLLKGTVRNVMITRLSRRSRAK